MRTASSAFRALLFFSWFWAISCAAPAPRSAPPGPPAPPEVVVSLIGTSDLHGHVEPTVFRVKDAAGREREVQRGGLPLFAGYVANLRQRNPVVLLDAGDLFQGTLTSNLSEGEVVIAAYNALGYSASAIGNHEFDYGPLGARSVPATGSGDDPVAALKTRIAEARFPFLAANIRDQATGQPIAWKNVYPSRLLTVPVPAAPGVELILGLVGATAEDTPRTTNALNLRGLQIEPVVPAVRREAEALRKQGAQAVILLVHEGGACKSFRDPRDLSSCQPAGEDTRVMGIARQLAGAVDVIVAGHTHHGMAHFVGPVAVVQSFATGRAFGRVDLTFRPGGWRPGLVLDPVRTRIFPPTAVCQVAARECDPRDLEGKPLEPASYAGAKVVPVPEVGAVIRPYAERAETQRREPLGIRSAQVLTRDYRGASGLGYLLADLARAGAAALTGKKVDLALQNGGGIRADLPAGDLTYGDFYEVVPFDNRLALVRMPGSVLLDLLRANMQGGAGVLLPSGAIFEARCSGERLDVRLLDERRRPLSASRTYTVAVSDFLASGGDNFGTVQKQLAPDAVRYFDDAPPLRDIMLQALRKRKSLNLDAPRPPRLLLPMPRPVRCGAPEKPRPPAPAPAPAGPTEP